LPRERARASRRRERADSMRSEGDGPRSWLRTSPATTERAGRPRAHGGDAPRSRRRAHWWRSGAELSYSPCYTATRTVPIQGLLATIDHQYRSSCLRTCSSPSWWLSGKRPSESAPAPPSGVVLGELYRTREVGALCLLAFAVIVNGLRRRLRAAHKRRDRMGRRPLAAWPGGARRSPRLRGRPHHRAALRPPAARRGGSGREWRRSDSTSSRCG